VATKRDYYEVMEISREASADDIRKAYRKLAMKYHPDRNPNNKAAEEKFKELSEAYEVLGDENKRQQYNQYGHAGMKSSFGPGGFDFSRDFTHYSDIEDILGTFFGGGGGGGGSMFENLFSGQRRSAGTGPQQGSDLRFDLEIDLEEAAYGSEREIALPVAEECTDCHGSGAAPGTQKQTCKQCGGRGVTISGGGFFQMRQTCPICGGTGQVIINPCRTCDGAGRVKNRKRVTLRIPRGVDTGARLRLAGKGEPGLRGGPAGDLYVILHVRQHELFDRHEDDILCVVPVPFDITTLGGEIEAPTLDGYAKLKIPPGTESGKVFRIRNRGMPKLNDYGRGDMHVKIEVEIPVRLSSQQKKLLQGFQAASSAENYPTSTRIRTLADQFYDRRSQLDKDNK